jgi:hypothetical protein
MRCTTENRAQRLPLSGRSLFVELGGAGQAEQLSHYFIIAQKTTLEGV